MEIKYDLIGGIFINIEDLSPCVNCETKECGLMDGNECDKLKIFLDVKRIVENTESEKRTMALFDIMREKSKEFII